jgi:hypothetical protein
MKKTYFLLFFVIILVFPLLVFGLDSTYQQGKEWIQEDAMVSSSPNEHLQNFKDAVTEVRDQNSANLHRGTRLYYFLNFSNLTGITSIEKATLNFRVGGDTLTDLTKTLNMYWYNGKNVSSTTLNYLNQPCGNESRNITGGYCNTTMLQNHSLGQLDIDKTAGNYTSWDLTNEINYEAFNGDKFAIVMFRFNRYTGNMDEADMESKGNSQASFMLPFLNLSYTLNPTSTNTCIPSPYNWTTNGQCYVNSTINLKANNSQFRVQNQGTVKISDVGLVTSNKCYITGSAMIQKNGKLICG